MRKKRIIIALIISMFFLSILVVYAETYLYNSYEVSYNNSNSNLATDNVQDALDELYAKCTSKPTTCPSGYTCTNKSNIKCKRAKTLHTSTCLQRNGYCSTSEGYNKKITYGSLGTSGVLTTGDAFDCDVNGDGIYNAANERFYYVSDYYNTTTKSFNNESAVLIYYTNTINGNINTGGAAYNSDYSSYDGPVTAAPHLPTISKWNNVSLYKTNRQILDQYGSTSNVEGNPLPVFNYTDKAARLITYQEVLKACGNTTVAITSSGGLNNCKFLFENTKYSSENFETYGIWLETNNRTVSNFYAYITTAYSQTIFSSLANYAQSGALYGIRPTIEISKSEILY